MKLRILYIILLSPFLSTGQNPIADFTIPTSVCINERIDFVNQSTNASSYLWDFCPELAGSISEVTVGNVGGNLPLSAEYVFDAGVWFGFVTDRSSNSLYRLDFGNSLSNEPSIINLGGLGGLLSSPDKIKLIQENEDWFGLILNAGNSSIIRLNWGDDLTNLLNDGLEATSLGNPSNSLSSPRGLELVQDGNDLFALLSNQTNNSITVIDFRNSITNDIAPADVSTTLIAGADVVLDIAYTRECDNLIAFTTSVNTNEIFRLDFDNNLLGTPNITIQDIPGLTSPRRVAQRFDGYSWKLFVLANDDLLYRLDFTDGIENDPVQDIITISPEITGFEFANDSIAMGIVSSSKDLIQYQFHQECNSSVNASTSFEPKDVSFLEAGDVVISLSAIGLDGCRSTLLDTITVLSSEAPLIDFDISPSRCVSVSNIFTPNLSGLTSYSWDFDSDGFEDSIEEVPSYQYMTSGKYLVRLTVNDGICENYIEKEIVIYEDPPLPSFAISPGGTFCTNNELTLTNTTNKEGYEDILTYQWIVDGLQINQTDTVFTFTSSGNKQISLQSFLPGCSSSIVTQEIILEEGVEVDFSYTNNCFGEIIQFSSDIVDEEGLTYAWNFGDGMGTSNDPDPSYTFNNAGAYSVILSVTNSLGCVTTSDQIIEVNDQSLVDFNSSLAIENLPISFDADDLTLGEDSIISWLWTFDEFGSGNSEDTTFIFPAGTYAISLSIITDQGCEETISKSIEVAESTCPFPDFDVDANFCIGERISFSNTSANAVSYRWDFCEELLGRIELDTVGTVGGTLPLSATYVNEDGNWFGFVTDRSASLLYRLDFGATLEGNPTIVNLGSVQGLLNFPDKIRMVKESNVWKGIVLNAGNSTLVVLDFGNSIANVPIGKLLESIEGLSSPRGLELLKEGEDYFAIVTNQNNNSVLTIKFGSSLDNEILEGDVNSITIEGVTSLFDVAIMDDCGSKTVLTVDNLNNRIYKVDFKEGLSSVPEVEEILVPSINAPRRVATANDGHGWKAFVIDDSDQIFRIDFSDGTSQSPSFSQEEGSLSLTAFEFATDSVLMAINSSSNELIKLSFNPECNASADNTNHFEPNDIRFFSSGSRSLSLTAVNQNGIEKQLRKVVTIAESSAPEISFILNDPRCILASNTFTSSTPGLTYSWDFNDDGIEDSNLESPEVMFDTLGGAGVYLVRLDVDDGICHNFTEEEITIYPEPPVPVIAPSVTTQCLNTDITITNTTDESQHQGVLAYQWDFDGDGSIDSTEPNPSFSISDPGIHTISVYSSIPGCESSASTFDLTILDGPIASFSSTTVCDTEAVSFTNSSQNAVSYFWDFTDGVTSTSESPSHVFASPGNYFVSLIATDGNGCEATQVNEIVVADNPEVMFDYGVLCTSSDGNLFEDESTINNADLISWQWAIDGVAVSTDQNPLLDFESTGLKDIGLTVVGSNGCETMYLEQVQVLEAPQPDFEVNIGCVGEVTSIADMSISNGNPINSWLWDVNGTSYVAEDIEHVFAEPGQYEITLEVSAQNFCSESVSKTIEVLQLPLVDFAIDGNCDNETIALTDQITEFNDPVISRQWMLDEQAIGNGTDILVSNLEEGTYEMTLQVETSNGCVVSQSQSITIDSSPNASFSFNKFYGVPNDVITFTNESSSANSFTWLQNGKVVGESAATEAIAFPEAGNYTIELVAQNDFGCLDTTKQEVIIRIPEVDLAIKDFAILEENGVGRVIIDVDNLSNLPVDVVNIQVNLQNQFSVVEQVETFIDLNSSEEIELQTRIPLAVSQPAYFCVGVGSQYLSYEDQTPLDNEKCTTINPSIVVEDPSPNPVIDQFKMRIISPSDGISTIRVISSSGKLKLKKELKTIAGLNNFFIGMAGLPSGLYFVVIDLHGNKIQKKLLKL